jgi:uncharacterized protein YdhG (YjbR/CyaY superfamily)
MQSKAKSIAEYLDQLAPKEREVVLSLNQLVREMLPNAVGSMKYGMPTYDCGARMFSFNAQKNYFSVYADPEILERYRVELKKLSVGKSCIRFTGMSTAPMTVLRSILRDYAT